MSQSYFSIPSFAKAKKNKEDLEKTKPEEPVLKESEQEFLHEQISNEDTATREDVPATKITDDGLEKEASKEEQEQVANATSQAIIPETQPEPPEDQRSYDDVMKDKAAERVKARKEKKRRSLDLPSQEEAEAATKGFNKLAAQEAESPQQATQRTWTAFLSSIRPSSRHSNEESTTDDKNQQTWKDIATSYVPNIPTKWRITSKDGTQQQPLGYNPSMPSTTEAPEATPTYNPTNTETAEKQQREISILLDQLSLSEINNRVFSFSTETQKIYERFAQVLKDTINGAPTAYDDMENLMKEAGPKLEKQFRAMPPFVQTLVKSLPARIGGTLGPELMAVAGEKPGVDLKVDGDGRPGTSDSGVAVSAASSEGTGEGKEKKKRRTIPGLKSLLSKEGAVASMLRNVVNFLQTRFPFLATGTNVVMSLAVFILMFVFWYCHKRGKETRLAKEAASGSDGEIEEIEEDEDTADEEAGEKAAEADRFENEAAGEGKFEEMQKYRDMERDIDSKAESLSQPTVEEASEVPLPDEGSEKTL